MSIIAELKERRAIRNYENREVDEGKIHQLLEAATWAPNDRMREPWSFYVIKGEAKQAYEQLAREYLDVRFPAKPKLIESSLKVVQSTPLIIVAAADVIPGDQAASEDNEYAVCCAIHSMWLAAKELGLGFVWRTRGVGLVRDKRLYDFVGTLPQDKRIIGTIFIGYPEAEALEKMKSPSRTCYTEKTVWL
ncbi:nitroreductase family protein [Pseudalkalibacillus decolorationis]|uniref:nitroreductase family protein n=1 Tax=Pseudalkalibacillus decolorationis TaxID=163879 RepID=UPI0021483E8A|nr:nitroreductase [Pseudalkalibacillus decolorationis]